VRQLRDEARTRRQAVTLYQLRLQRRQSLLSLRELLIGRLQVGQAGRQRPAHLGERATHPIHLANRRASDGRVEITRRETTRGTSQRANGTGHQRREERTRDKRENQSGRTRQQRQPTQLW
jgi:hypothetical protein